MPNKDISESAAKLSLFLEDDINRYIDWGDYDKQTASHNAIMESKLSEDDAEKIISYCLSTLDWDGAIDADKAIGLRESCNEFIKRLSENGKRLIAKMPFYMGEKDKDGVFTLLEKFQKQEQAKILLLAISDIVIVRDFIDEHDDTNNTD